MEPKNVFTVAEAAEVTGCHPNTLRSAIKRGDLKAAKVGGRAFKISKADLVSWYKNQGGGALFEQPTSPKPAALEEVYAALNEIIAPVALHEDAWSILREEYAPHFIEREGNRLAAVALKRVGLVLWGSPTGNEFWAIPKDTFEEFMDEWGHYLTNPRAGIVARALLRGGANRKEK